MEFRPSSSQQMLVATAREVLRKECPPELVQRLALDARGFDDALWRRLAELGWPGLLIPPELGGSGGSLLDVILLVEEIGRAGLPGPFVTSESHRSDRHRSAMRPRSSTTWRIPDWVRCSLMATPA